MDSINQDVTIAVRKYLKDRYPDYRQRHLAQDMGIHETELSEILSGKRNWTLNLMMLLSKVTGLVFQVGATGDD